MRASVQQFMLGKALKNKKSAREVLTAIRKANYTEIELCGFMIHKTSPIVRILTYLAGMPTGNCGSLDWHVLIKESGLRVTSLHFDLGSLENNTQCCIDEAKSFDTKYIVITGMYRFDYTNSKSVSELAKRLNKMGEVLAEQSIFLLYHNHNVELLYTDDGRRAYEILIQETDPRYVNFEFDSYWFADGGADPVYWMRTLGKRMKLWHINDRGTKQRGAAMTPILKSDSMELGTGNMPLDKLINEAKSLGCESVILESHRNWLDGSPVKSLQKSGEFLKKYLN